MHVLDCITDVESATVSFEALGRTGGRYACLEEFHDTWQTRRAVKVKVVMGFEMQGLEVVLGHGIYTRKARPELHELGMIWTKEMQALLYAGSIMTQPIRELDGGFDGIIKGLHLLKAGKLQAQKLVARVAQ